MLTFNQCIIILQEVLQLLDRSYGAKFVVLVMRHSELSSVTICVNILVEYCHRSNLFVNSLHEIFQSLEVHFEFLNEFSSIFFD